MLTREDIPIRERTFWRMLYETTARSAEVLSLDVEDLDLPNRRARVRRKGGAIDVIVWQTGTARLLPRLLKGRTSGPVFVTERKARVQLPAVDLDPAGRARLSYQQAAALFSEASGGATLHQLRHSALTHDAEDGTGTPMLMARSVVRHHDDHGVLPLPGLLQVVQQPADVMVGVRQEPRVPLPITEQTTPSTSTAGKTGPSSAGRPSLAPGRSALPRLQPSQPT